MVVVVGVAGSGGGAGVVCRGIASGEFVDDGPELKSEHAQPGTGIPPDMLVVVTADAKVFHVAGCGVIHNKDTERTLTAKQAMEQGYVPCLRCLRQYLQTATAGHVALESEADADGGMRTRECTAAGGEWNQAVGIRAGET